jgi:hypothetical protein
VKLDERHVVEDPVLHDSRVSQWTQIADLVAYCANLTLDRYAGNEFGWHWYERYLAPLDPHGRPRELVRTQLDPPGPREWGGSAFLD